jgi:hypothetical protein
VVSANPGIHIVVGAGNRGPTQAKVGSIVIRQYTAQSEFIVQVVVVVVANRGEKTTVSTRSREVIDKGKSLYAKKKEEERVSFIVRRSSVSPLPTVRTLPSPSQSFLLLPYPNYSPATSSGLPLQEAGFPPPLYVACNIYWCFWNVLFCRLHACWKERGVEVPLSRKLCTAFSALLVAFSLQLS